MKWLIAGSLVWAQVGAADVPPPVWSMGGGASLAECSAIFSLLTPQTPDQDLQKDFDAQQAKFFEKAIGFHGVSFTEARFREAVTYWETLDVTLQHNVTLAHRLDHCHQLSEIWEAKR